MRLERFRDTQMEELMQWADSLENILTPDNLNPVSIKDYPHYIQTSERLKRICKWKSTIIKDQLTNIEDVTASAIEAAEIVLKHDSVGIPITQKKYNTNSKRERELRLRLGLNERYQTLLQEKRQWDIMYSDWVSHVKRLQKDFDLLEVNYISNGGEGINL